jgi:hypothetical protein
MDMAKLTGPEAEALAKEFAFLWPYPQELTARGTFAAPQAVRLAPAAALAHAGVSLRLAEDLRTIARLSVTNDPAAYPVALQLDASVGHLQGYRLTLAPEGARIAGADEPGLANGTQTLLQILARAHAEANSDWPDLQIDDWPAFLKRGCLLDPGRSAFSMPLYKRMVRILARLKLNQLHLHLYDDELCGLRFAGLPFGQENPYAITIADLAELVRYAAQYHVEILPELEAWGHVGSLVYHRPELCGGEGMYSGSSFLIGEGAFAPMRELVRQVVEVMPRRATIHLGLDEAQWFLDPAMPPDFTPEQLVGRYAAMLQEIGAETGHELTLQIWADHGGRPVPPEVQPNTIIQPWGYWMRNAPQIDEALARYSGPGKMRWNAGAGQSVGGFRGSYHGTRYWCQRAVGSPNVDGVDITLWGTNDLERQMLSLFAGAYYAWNPAPPTSFADADDYELFDWHVIPTMYRWQLAFRDAYPDDLLRDRGPLVVMGYYLWGSRHGEPVSPEVVEAHTTTGHEYLCDRL